MSHHLFTLLFYILTPLLTLLLLWRSRRQPVLRSRWKEFFGLYGSDRDRDGVPTVVFHAVSVGEVHAAAPLIESFLAKYPDWHVVVTCSSVTGSSRIQTLFGERVEHVFLPYDLPGAVRRFLNRFSPRLIIILETELWPNLIHQAHARRVRVMLANGRLSEKSCRGYARLGKMVADMMCKFDRVSVQSQADADRFSSLGLDRSKISIAGNIKYDVQIAPEQPSGCDLRQHCFGNAPVFIAASTREGEDEKILRAFQLMRAERPDLALILVPRHPERFEDAVNLFREAGFAVLRRSCLPETEVTRTLDVLVGDTMGELPTYYSMADVAFVGGSLVGTGCQNIIEPATLGLPVITGPSLYNFQAASEELFHAGGQKIVQNEQELAQRVLELIANPRQRQRMGESAQRAVERCTGATNKVLQKITALIA